MELILAWTNKTRGVTLRKAITRPGEIISLDDHIELLGNPEKDECEAKELFGAAHSLLLFLGWKVKQPAQDNLGGGKTVIFSLEG